MRKFLAIMLLLVFPAGCALRSHEAPPEDVDKASALFFQRLNSAAYDTIYKDTAKKFKQAKTKEEIIDSLKELTAKGRLQDYQRVRMTFEGEGADRMAVPVFSALFEQAKGDITLYFVDESGEWRLIGFAYKQRG
jgi:hypothetical protein